MVKYLDNNSGFNQWNATRAQQAKSGRSIGFWGWLILFLLSWWIIGTFFQSKKVQNEIQQPVNIEVSNLNSVKQDSDKISFDVTGLRISNVALKEHKQSAGSDDLVTLLNDENNFVEIGFVSSDTQTPNINTKWENKTNEMRWQNKDKVHFTRNISAQDYLIKISDTIKNNSKSEINLTPYARIITGAKDRTTSVVETGGVVYANSNLDYENWNDLNRKSYAFSTVKGSLGFAEQYWETIVSIDANDQTISLKKNGELYFADTMAAPIKVMAGAEKTIDTYLFTGPRIAKVLDAASENIPGISQTVDYGWFWFFAQPMLWMINWLFAFVGNYGIAIILMTLILRLLMWPLTRKSYVSTMAMQKMQPELQRIQKLYANDKARQQVEMMRVYQTYKTSPMSGCLPMLLQIPIFFALYKALLISVPMRSAHFLWISDLAVMDPYFILPILMGATMWLQQVLQSSQKTTNKNDPMASTQRVMKWLPILFTFMFAWMPAGLVLYWTVSNIFGIFQMYVIKKTVK